MDSPTDQRFAGTSGELDEMAIGRKVEIARLLDADRRTQRRLILERRRAEARQRRNRLLAGLAIAVAGSGVFVVVSSLGASQSHADPVAPHLLANHALASSYVVPGRAPTFAWPAAGSGAVAVLGEGLVGASPGEHAVPIASLTKMMTAFVVLNDHPISLGEEGPKFTMTAADVASWVRASQTDESNAPVRLGEVLTEHQLLEALLLPSADNIADYLAAWDGGSMARFVKKMNVAAKSLGLESTHYADASGIDPGSRSTAANQAILAAKLMENPVVRSIVSHPALPFPVAGTIYNFNPALGIDGIVGIKSGFTSHALGCLAIGAYKSVAGHAVMVVTVSLGQPDALYGAARMDENLLDQAAKKLVLYRPLRSGTSVGTVVSAAGSQSVVVADPSPAIVGFSGLTLRSSYLPASRNLARGGQIQLSTPYGVVARASVVAAPAKAIAPPTVATTLPSTVPTTVPTTLPVMTPTS